MPDEGLGLGWIAIGLTGFACGFVGTKLRVLTQSTLTRFCTVASGLVALAAAFLVDATAGGIMGFLGRAAVFAIIWLVFGIVFTIGVAMGAGAASE